MSRLAYARGNDAADHRAAFGVADRISAAAAEQQLEPAVFVAQMLSEAFPARRRLSFAGIGRSTTELTAADAEEMLRSDFGS